MKMQSSIAYTTYNSTLCANIICDTKNLDMNSIIPNQDHILIFGGILATKRNNALNTLNNSNLSSTMCESNI